MGYILMIIFIAVGIGLISCFFVLRSKIQQLSKTLFGTKDIIKGFQSIQVEEAATPKSLNAMTSLYLPKIKKDFPEFSYDEMKVRANNVLTSYLLSLDNATVSRLSEGSPELKEKLEGLIDGLKAEGCDVNYKQTKLHRTEISNYRKEAGRCIITFQVSCQYYYTKVKESGEVKEGSNDLLTQARYDIDVIYIQDRDKIENEHDFALGTNCPNCGAPLKGLGAKICEYCGTPLQEINIYAWAFSDVRKSA